MFYEEFGVMYIYIVDRWFNHTQTSITYWSLNFTNFKVWFYWYVIIVTSLWSKIWKSSSKLKRNCPIIQFSSVMISNDQIIMKRVIVTSTLSQPSFIDLIIQIIHITDNVNRLQSMNRVHQKWIFLGTIFPCVTTYNFFHNSLHNLISDERYFYKIIYKMNVNLWK